MNFLAGYLVGSRSAARAGRLAASAHTMKAAPPSGKIADLDERIDRLAVVVEAMWTLLEESGYSAADLEDKVAELEERVLDAPIKTAVKCPSCEALVPRGLAACQFCGAATGQEPTPFGGIAT